MSIYYACAALFLFFFQSLKKGQTIENIVRKKSTQQIGERKRMAKVPSESIIDWR